jgi:hypothetical protein
MNAQLDKATNAIQVDLPLVAPTVAHAPDELSISKEAAAPATALQAHAVWFGIHAGTARANHRKARHAHTHTHTHTATHKHSKRLSPQHECETCAHNAEPSVVTTTFLIPIKPAEAG